MTSSSNEQDLVFKARFEDDASEDIQNLDEDVQGLDSSMGGLSLSAVTAGLAMFGVGVGVSKLVGTVQDTTHAAAALKAQIVLLPDGTQEAINAMRDDFDSIGLSLAATGLEVEDVAVGIAASSGGIVPSIADIEAAFALMRTKGIEAGEAADIVGQALQGNEEPLNNLLDPSGRSYISYKQVLEDLVPVAQSLITPIDRLSAAIRSSVEDLTDLNFLAENFFELGFGDDPPQWGPKDSDIDSWDDIINKAKEFFGLGETGSLPDTLREMREDSETLGGLGLSSEQQGNLSPVNPLPGFNGSGITGFGDIHIHMGDVDTAARAQELARKIDQQLRNLARGGTGTFS